MGLDIAFNKELAVAAGMEFVSLRDDDAILDSLVYRLINGHFQMGDDHFKWLAKETPCIKVPRTNHYIADGGIDDVVVRANHWGGAYGPLTDWLIDNDIKWSEF